MIIFESDEMQIVSGENIRTGAQEIQWNFYVDYVVLSPENFGAMIAGIFQKSSGMAPEKFDAMIAEFFPKK